MFIQNLERTVRQLGDREGMALFPLLARPKSRGSVTLRSRDYQDLPIVDLNIYGDKADIELSVKGEVQLLKCITILIWVS